MPNVSCQMRHLFALSLGMLGLCTASATTVNFDNIGTFTAPSLNRSGMAVTGSALVGVNNLNGLGVAGGFGAPANFFDGTEYLDFDFSGLGGARDVFYVTRLSGGAAEKQVSIFGIDGGLLGQFNQAGLGTYNLSSLVGGAAIGHFRLQMVSGYTFINSVSFSEVPEPASWALVGLALLGLGHQRRQRRLSGR